jgi:hypothetical protein
VSGNADAASSVETLRLAIETLDAGIAGVVCSTNRTIARSEGRGSAVAAGRLVHEFEIQGAYDPETRRNSESSSIR